MKTIKFLLVFFICSAKVFAQDAILISEGNFVRGVIKGTNFVSVAITEDDINIKEYQAKDIHSFVWNGETYASKPILVKKKMEFKFFKVLESGNVNLYSYGDKAETPQAPQPRPKIKPTFGLGMGTGGFGGGLGGGITIGGGGRRDIEQPTNGPKQKVTYFIEKPGSGPMQEVNLDNTNAVKTILLQKLTNDDDLAQSIKATEGFDAKNLAAYVKAYNSSEKK